MKSAYELAMERLNKTAPPRKLTAEQKSRLADLESLYKAKIAQEELAFQADLQAAEAAGEFARADSLRAEFAATKRRLEGELEERKERVRTE